MSSEPKKPRVAIVTVSDSVSRGQRQDRSGPELADRCRALGWQVVSSEALSDDRDALEMRLAALAESDSIDLVLTTGGTGVGPRDTHSRSNRRCLRKIVAGSRRAHAARRAARKILAPRFRAPLPECAGGR